MCTSNSTKSGFTIVELLVVIVVIGILAAITIVAYRGISQRAIVSTLQSDLNSASTQLKMYQATDDSNKFPDADDCSVAPANKTICLKHSSGNNFTYTPDNSTNTATYVLDVDNDGLTYRITNDSAPVAVIVAPSQGPLSAGATVDVSPSNPISDSYDISNQNAVLNCIFSSKTGQSFTGNGGILNSAQFEIRKYMAPTGSVYARIYAHSGVYGTSSIPTGSALATSDAFDISTLTTTFQLISFNFSGANKINLANGTNYVIAVEYPASGSYGMTFGNDNTPTHAGNFVTNSGSWVADITRDMIFYVYTDATQNLAWTSPNNIQVNDNLYATASINNADALTHYLKATNYGFSIPVGSTINGILVEVERMKSSSGTIVDNAVQIVKSNGTLGVINKADIVTDWPAAESYASYGSSSDLWGETWAPSDINDVDFGMAVSAKINNSGGDNIASIDHIRIKVYYTAP